MKNSCRMNVFDSHIRKSLSHTREKLTIMFILIDFHFPIQNFNAFFFSAQHFDTCASHKGDYYTCRTISGRQLREANKVCFEISHTEKKKSFPNLTETSH